ncbi:MAG: glycosyltransferase family 9 protein [Ignavibacterium album]|uniref:glycosyltransferase family 9 protein n=1 Tax=Ignavibacterium album TaxID=591197 RepID=UPI0026F03881|nr:glycosyltransferase family 9 protein [Ignavibacterium album]MBI5662323.1 glycosyltransferase family 9 protein [Ignavibacterium album]
MKKIELIFIKLGNLINFIITSLIIKIIHQKRRTTVPRTLLLIRLDSIGDFILVHNFFAFFRTHPVYKEYKITLCGNIIWKDLAEYLNENTFDSFIWINRKKFKWNFIYKHRILNQIYKAGYETVIETTFTREILYGDTIVKASKARERIGSTGSPDSYLKWKRKIFSDDYYTKLITQSEKNLFEFYRNKEFFEKLLQTKIEITKPSMNFDKVEYKHPVEDEFIVVVPGAQEKARRWSENNFRELIKHLLKDYQYSILVAGSASEQATIQKILEGIESERVFDVSGKTTLSQLGKIISKAKFLISNETSAVHFAAAVNTPFVCISNGQRFGRFMPYPEEMKIVGTYIFPPKMIEHYFDKEYLIENFNMFLDLNINDIDISYVIFNLKKQLNNT